jgi:hypothetical protein
MRALIRQSANVAKLCADRIRKLAAEERKRLIPATPGENISAAEDPSLVPQPPAFKGIP